MSSVREVKITRQIQTAPKGIRGGAAGVELHAAYQITSPAVPMQENIGVPFLPVSTRRVRMWKQDGETFPADAPEAVDALTGQAAMETQETANDAPQGSAGSENGQSGSRATRANNG